jgi:hypothetical protein
MQSRVKRVVATNVTCYTNEGGTFLDVFYIFYFDEAHINAANIKIL